MGEKGDNGKEEEQEQKEERGQEEGRMKQKKWKNLEGGRLGWKEMAKVMKGGKEKEGKMTEEQSREREKDKTQGGVGQERRSKEAQKHMAVKKILAFHILT